MFTVEIDTRDIEEAWAAAVAEIGLGVARGVQQGLSEGAKAAVTTGRWQDRTGRTRERTQGVVETITRNGAVGTLQSLVPHASYLEEGTGPHEIRAKQGGVLRWESGGESRFARVVQHPGTKATGYMGAGLQKCERVILREIESSVDRAQSILDRY